MILSNLRMRLALEEIELNGAEIRFTAVSTALQ